MISTPWLGKGRTTLFAGLLALPMGVVSWSNWTSDDAGSTSEPAAPVCPVSLDDETPMHEQMEIIEDGLKKLRRGLRKAEQNPESLKTTVAMQEAAFKCKGMVPAMTANQPEDQRAAFVSRYQVEMAKCLKSMLDLEIAILEGDNARAQELYKELKLGEEAGHEAFTEDG